MTNQQLEIHRVHPLDHVRLRVNPQTNLAQTWQDFECEWENVLYWYGDEPKTLENGHTLFCIQRNFKLDHWVFRIETPLLDRDPRAVSFPAKNFRKLSRHEEIVAMIERDHNAA